MSIKINGREFDFDKDDLFPGVKPKSDQSTVKAWCIIGGGFLLALFWWKIAGFVGLWSFFKIFPFFRGYL